MDYFGEWRPRGFLGVEITESNLLVESVDLERREQEQQSRWPREEGEILLTVP